MFDPKIGVIAVALFGSMAIVPVAPDMNVMDWSFVGDVAETWYAKPSGGRLLVSPAEAEPVEPHDAYADNMTLAEGIARFQINLLPCTVNEPGLEPAVIVPALVWPSPQLMVAVKSSALALVLTSVNVATV